MLSWHFNHSTILHQSRRVQSFTSLLHRLLFGFVVHAAFCYSLLVFSLCLLLHNTPPRTSVGRPQGCNRRCPISHLSIIGHARSNVCVPCRPVPFHAVPCLNVFKRNFVFHPSTSFKAMGNRVKNIQYRILHRLHSEQCLPVGIQNWKKTFLMKLFNMFKTNANQFLFLNRRVENDRV